MTMFCAAFARLIWVEKSMIPLGSRLVSTQNVTLKENAKKSKKQVLVSQERITDIKGRFPKKPFTSYIMFANDNRPNILKNNPGIRANEVMKMVGEMWRDLPTENKNKYQEQASANFAGYASEVKTFKESLTDDDKMMLQSHKAKQKEIKKKRMIKMKCKQLGKPKRQGGPFALFIASQEYKQGAYAKDNFSDLAKKYNELPESEKKALSIKATEKLKEYKEKLKAWEEDMLARGYTNLLPKPKPEKTNKSIKTRKSDKK